MESRVELWRSSPVGDWWAVLSKLGCSWRFRRGVSGRYWSWWYKAVADRRGGLRIVVVSSGGLLTLKRSCSTIAT